MVPDVKFQMQLNAPKICECMATDYNNDLMYGLKTDY